MVEEDEPIVIKPPHSINSKVSIGGAGAVDLEALKRAEEVIAGMSGNYLEWVEEDLVKIQKAFDALKSGKPEDHKHLLDQIFRVAHDIKGQGGSFDYGMMTILGNGLCRFVEQTQTVGSSEFQVIQLYIDTMKLVISKRMSGDGGKEGEQVLRGLDMVVAKTANKQAV
ncbi:MAG: hypothetical protein A3G18_01055 [Rhodospirillales bacterium RIFCSPLOWO2_12_FULL_58_28]|nr:MAG: hypothetical protein A3H92_04255 [Rhodospirillales bacterium RIFCSPLOWO2_02_FULL_58_16]OHC77992.1 MAG: hypothetical protein A3G18_01055 [Rhodospirillales bacterium RIFCSPLOWO2_12_FULL_58_28]